MDSSLSENTNYNECEVYPLGDEQQYAVFYDKYKAESCNLPQKTEEEIINEIRVGRDLIKDIKEAEPMEKEEIKVIYLNLAGNKQIEDVQSLVTCDVVFFTDVRNTQFNEWKKYFDEDYSTIQMPCFKPNEESTGYGGILVFYKKNINVINHGRFFTWKLLNMEEGKIYPGVEGVYIDIWRGGKISRIGTMFHWKQLNSKGFDPRVNTINFISNFLTKPCPSFDKKPDEIHIIGKFNFSIPDFTNLLHDKLKGLVVAGIQASDTAIVSSNFQFVISVIKTTYRTITFTVHV